MKLNKTEHRRIMLEVLDEISKDALLANNLGFKGGTACYFLYGLDRFSVDLDFDLLNKDKEKIIKEKLLDLLDKFGEVKTKTSIEGLFPTTDFCQNPPVLPSACQKKFTNTPYLCTFFDGALDKTEKFSSKTVIGNSPIKYHEYNSKF